MKGAWAAPPQASDNTVRIAQMCDLQLDFSKRYAPVYRVPKEKLRAEGTEARRHEGTKDEGPPPAAPSCLSASVPSCLPKKDDELSLRQLCEDGLVWRYGTTDVAPEVRAR